MWSAMSAHEPSPYISAPSSSSSSSSAPHSRSKMGKEFCSMTRKACVAGSWALRDSPLPKQGTQRSKSEHAGSAHRMRTFRGGAYVSSAAGPMTSSGHQHPIGACRRMESLTVDVMSHEQTSHTYLTPPSPPLVAVFLRMTPISIAKSVAAPRRLARWLSRLGLVERAGKTAAVVRAAADEVERRKRSLEKARVQETRAMWFV